MIDIYLFGAIVFLLAVMDFFAFQMPYDKGFWSLHTKGSKYDIWHSCKRVILFLVAFSMLGSEYILEMFYGFIEISMNPYVLFAVLAYGIQRFFYNFLFKKFK